MATEATFVVPSCLQEHLGADPIIFFQPSKGHRLSPDARFAVRCNENYADVKACLENERAYVRQAALKAENILMYRCVAKHPVLVMSAFREVDIKVGATRAIESAVARAITIRPPTGARRIDLGEVVTNQDPMHRLTGPLEALNAYAASAEAHHHYRVKDSHMERAGVAHAYLNETELAKAKESVLVEAVRHITASEQSPFQLTLRDKTQSCDALLKIGIQLQTGYGALCTLRTYGTLRVTFPEAVDASTYKWLKERLPSSMAIFTDTPINVWAEGTDNKKSTRSEAVNTAQSEGNVVVRFASDSTPHPSVFEALARHFGGTLLEVCDDKFNTAAMGCLIKFSAEVWSSSVLPTVADAFSISDTVWLATPLRHKTKV
jgi:hypothetical protein